MSKSDTNTLEMEALLEKVGGHIFAQPDLTNCLSFVETKDTIPEGSICLSIQLILGSWVHLWFQPNDLPLNLTIGRVHRNPISPKERQMIIDNQSSRSAVLLLPGKSISRFKLASMNGHATIRFLSCGKLVEIADQGSTKGTYLTQTIKETISASEAEGDKTENYTQDARDWKQLTKESMSEYPIAIRMGDSRFVAGIKK